MGGVGDSKTDSDIKNSVMVLERGKMCAWKTKKKKSGGGCKGTKIWHGGNGPHSMFKKLENRKERPGRQLWVQGKHPNMKGLSTTQDKRTCRNGRDGNEESGEKK